jgi:hypothetical protein
MEHVNRKNKERIVTLHSVTTIKNRLNIYVELRKTLQKVIEFMLKLFLIFKLFIYIKIDTLFNVQN